MKKIFTLCVGLFAALALQAQSDFPLHFVDKNGNEIADGSTLIITDWIDDGFGGIMVPSGLAVKNTSDAEVQCAGAFTVRSISNGAFQSCFPMNCMQARTVGDYTTQNGAMAAGDLKNMQTEWLPDPDSEGTCTVVYQLITYKQNPITKQWTVDKYGPTVTMNFAYGTTGINNAPTSNAQRSTCYDLMGRRVSKPAKGVYIINGRQVVIK